MENEETKPQEEKPTEVNDNAQLPDNTENKPDRPEINYQKELERKNEELKRARQELESLKTSSAPRRDSNDISTWPDHELKALKYSNDPNLAQYRAQAEDILVERKFNYLRERERLEEKRFSADKELRSQYPEALDNTTEMGYRVEQVMKDFDLQKSPAGRLAAAKIVAAELSKGKDNSDAEGRKRESERVRDVKSQMTDGDRPRPVSSSTQKKNEELTDALLDSRHPNRQVEAVGEILKNRGIDGKSFFGKR